MESRRACEDWKICWKSILRGLLVYFAEVANLGFLALFFLRIMFRNFFKPNLRCAISDATRLNFPLRGSFTFSRKANVIISKVLFQKIFQVLTLSLLVYQHAYETISILYLFSILLSLRNTCRNYNCKNL
jgi:hypothetical protein